jgi:hypothetical protein
VKWISAHPVVRRFCRHFWLLTLRKRRCGVNGRTIFLVQISLHGHRLNALSNQAQARVIRIKAGYKYLSSKFAALDRLRDAPFYF